MIILAFIIFWECLKINAIIDKSHFWHWDSILEIVTTPSILEYVDT